MKKTLLSLLVVCLLNFQSKSQYNYASIWVGYPLGYELSSGFATQANPGYFWLGYLPTVQNVSTTWYINKNFSIMGVGASSISVSYKIFDAPNCNNAPLNQVLNGYGISAIETKGANNSSYAMAGAYDKACYFTTIDNAGNVLAAVSYPFPYYPTGLFAAPSKPILVESATVGQYYVCGSFESKMYVIKVDGAGLVLWSSFYTLGLDVQPKDILVDPNNGSLIVVGQTTSLLVDKQGFFMRLDGSNGNVIMTKTYGDFGIQEGFKTIIPVTPANATSPSGFILGGQTQLIASSEKPWLIKLDAQGNITWSRLFAPTMGSSASVVDVIERLNTLNGYEYYTLLNSNAGLHVLKLDYSGQPFPSSSNSPHNEFVYDLPTSTPSKATSISYINGAVSTSDVGIQVFGTSAHWPGFSSSYVVNAYFNGETNCYPTLTTMSGFVSGPMTITTPIVLRSGNFSSCANFQVVAFPIGASINYPCYGPIPAGDNQRTLHTEDGSIVNKSEEFSVSPNPTQDKTLINYSSLDNSKIGFALYNLLGELVWQKHSETLPAGTYQEELDFNSLSLEKGIYIAVVTIDGKTHKQKVIYTK